MFRWLKPSPRRETADRLYAAIMTAARRPALYLHLGAHDTMDGRFEMLALHAAPALRRLDALGKAGDERAADLAKELADSIFRHLDATLREQGVGDLAVPKRMKKFAENFYGRLAAYEDAAAREDEPALRRALARNVLGDESRQDEAAALAQATLDMRAAFSAASFELLAEARPPYPALDPARAAPNA